MDFCYTMTFLQCVHGVYDEKMEAVDWKSSQNDSFSKDSESTYKIKFFDEILIIFKKHCTSTSFSK